MLLKTSRLELRPFQDSDAESLFLYASDPAVGPCAGWPPHQSVSESLEIIRTILSGPECYAICEKGSAFPIGAAELMLYGQGNKAQGPDECELGFWLGQPFWGRGYMTEAAGCLLERAFSDLGMKKVWSAYYDGNDRSKRVQEKLGFHYDHTETDTEVPLLDEVRTLHVNKLTREAFEAAKR